MAEKVRPIYVKDLINMLDYNRDLAYPIKICEEDEADACTLNTSSIALDLMKDMEVDSMSVDEGVLKIWLSDNAVSGYWDKYKVERKDNE